VEARNSFAEQELKKEPQKKNFKEIKFKLQPLWLGKAQNHQIKFGYSSIPAKIGN